MIAEQTDVQQRMDRLDQKLDLILERLDDQHKASQMRDDLMDDLGLVTKDFYQSAVTELDKRQIVLDTDVVLDLIMSLMKNLDKIKGLLDGLEMAADLKEDMGPIAHDAIKDLNAKIAVLNQRGYFDFFRELGPILDNIVTGFRPEELRELAQSIVSILKTVKEMTQPEVMSSMKNAVRTFNSMETDEIPSYSVWQLIKEMNSPEMKKALGFGITFMKNMSADK